MKPSKLSIILPVYNGEAFLEKAVESVIKQTYQSWELILVNDGSTDNSEKICLRYQEQDHRISYINQENRGLSAARNSGIHLAHGEYIAYLDADDYVEADYYEKMVVAFEKHKSDLVVSGFIREFTHKDRPAKQLKTAFANILFSDEESLKEHLKEPFIYNLFIHVWNKLYLRKLLVKHNIGFDENIRFGEDVLYNILYLKQIKKIFMVDICGYHYVCRETERLTNTWHSFLPEYNSKLYNGIIDFMHEYWNTDLLVIPAEMYLRGCFLNIEKALAANLPLTSQKQIIQTILNADETKSTLIMRNLTSLEFKIYQVILKSRNFRVIKNSVRARVLIKRCLGR
ncbi:glycosyltransferase family 2 protein [Hungatella sp. L12]|uniref:Glycosyltransferase family 2 protein n=1 Tax=Hungatella hominis TaxID=2763050 RepID=A0ABR7HA52_9FIRM|nr:glycosyltransferase family 2 protein [Hungatella hominis]MBC5710073.1 glycosyltransferase family 2 protein [Hungatella hominis]